MSNQNATCEALWRASAEEGVAYADTDFPEVLLIHPELYDGSINQGKATHISTTYEFLPNNKVRCTTEDNGQGITNMLRFCTWAAPSSASIHHRYGHGTKKYLTKAQPNYATSDWVLQWRNKSDLGHLNTVRGPYRGIEMEYLKSEDPTDTTTMPTGGTRFTVDIDVSLFHGLNTVPALFAAEKEIICSRHPKQLDDGSVQFTLTVKNGEQIMTENSVTDHWTSLRTLLAAQEEDKVTEIIDEEHSINGGTMHFSVYYISKAFTRTLKALFPVYGRRNQSSSRMHLSLGGRMIEARPLHYFLGKRTNHNDLNGYIGFVDFEPNSPADFERLPKPTTTKVKFSDECASFQAAARIIAASMENNTPNCGWKNLPSGPAPDSSDSEVEPDERLADFGITITSGRGLVHIAAEGHETRLYPGTAHDRDFMKRHAAAKPTAVAAYRFLMDLVSLLTA